MAFGGAVSAMVQSIKMNRAQLTKRNNYFEKGLDTEKMYGDFVDHKKMPPAQFQVFKEKLQQQEKDRIRQVIIIFSIVMSIIIGFLGYFMFVF